MAGILAHNPNNLIDTKPIVEENKVQLLPLMKKGRIVVCALLKLPCTQNSYSLAH